MSEKLYVTIFDQLDPSFDPLGMRDALKSFDDVSHWWNHIPNCFLISSHLDAASLTTWLRKQTGNVGFLVIEANPRNSEGHLPKRSWDWMEKVERELAAAE